MTAPPKIYDSVNFDRYKPKTLYGKINQLPKNGSHANKDDHKIKKDNSVSPATYNLEGKHFVMSTVPKPKIFKFSTGKKMTFTELEAKRQSANPGVGKYDVDLGRNRITLGARKSYK